MRIDTGVDLKQENNFSRTSVCKFGHVYVCVLTTQSCSILWDPMSSSPPGPSVHEIPQARILEWVAVPFSKESSQTRD